MLGINYFKAEPTQYARISVNGKAVKEGKGISALYLPFRTSMELISLAANDQSFVFREVSNDNQDVTLQGGFIYKIEQPQLVLGMFNCSINPETNDYQTDDYQKLPQQLTNLVQVESRKIVQTKKLEELLFMNDKLSQDVSEVLKDSALVKNLGVAFNLLYFSSITAKPEIAKALEAKYREELLQKQDEVIYARRAKAVEKELQIKENELATQIKIETGRKNLVEIQSENIKAEALAKSDALKLELIAFGNMDAEQIRAHALYQLGKNAARIETLTITPEILAGLARK